MKATYLRFKDGYQAIFLGKDRVNCLIVHPGETVTINFPKINETECRSLKCTHRQWLNRWVK